MAHSTSPIINALVVLGVLASYFALVFVLRRRPWQITAAVMVEVATMGVALLALNTIYGAPLLAVALTLPLGDAELG